MSCDKNKNEMQNTEIYKIKKIFIESRLNLFGNILFVILINSIIERTPKKLDNI